MSKCPHYTLNGPNKNKHSILDYTILVTERYCGTIFITMNALKTRIIKGLDKGHIELMNF